jgi:hypothetical protein
MDSRQSNQDGKGVRAETRGQWTEVQMKVAVENVLRKEMLKIQATETY